MQAKHWGTTLAAMAVMVATTGVSTQTPKPTNLRDIAPGPAVDRTTPLLNALTPAQRYHSTLFPEYRTSPDYSRVIDVH
jgi:hypothetical protein